MFLANNLTSNSGFQTTIYILKISMSVTASVNQKKKLSNAFRVDYNGSRNVMHLHLLMRVSEIFNSLLFLSFL